MAFIIEKGILPQKRKYARVLLKETKELSVIMPEKPFNKSRNSIYPFGKLLVGDSFIICDKYTRELHQHYNNAARNYKNKSPNKSNWRFSVRRWNANAIRVWRVA